MKHCSRLFVIIPLCMAAFLYAQPAAKPDSGTGKAAVEVTKSLPPQTTCPVMGGAIDKKEYVDYQGKRIYVCCPGCKEEVARDPEKYIRQIEASGHSVEVIAAVKTPAKKAPVKKVLAPQTTCPVMGGPIDPALYVDYKGRRIYVCCEGCLAKVEKNPAKYIKMLEKSGQAVEVIRSGDAKAADDKVKGE